MEHTERAHIKETVWKDDVSAWTLERKVKLYEIINHGFHFKITRGDRNRYKLQ